jgi:hypothetical protein
MNPTTSRRRRWDNDARGIGVADARAWQPLVASLAEAADTDGWIAEDPETHLLPHLVAAAERGPARIRRAETDPDGTFVVELTWIGPSEPTRGAVRAVLFDLVGAIAETVTLVHEPPAARGRELEVLTGATDGDGGFAGHGHALRFRVSAPASGSKSSPE